MKRWKKLIICSVSFLVLFFGEIAINMACGPQQDPYDYYPSFFHNTIQDNNSFKSFYFNGMLFLNDEANLLKESDINALEWRNYLGKRVSLADINKAMYELKGDADSLLLLKYLKPNGTLPDSLKKNTFLKALVSGRHNEALNYYRLAKTAEPLVVQNYDNRWRAIPLDNKKLKSLSAQALKYAKAIKDPFIRLRCFYQALRLLYYSNDASEGILIYDKYIAGTKSKSHVLGWALSFRAGYEQYHGNPAKAAYMFSKVFTKYPERRIQAFYEFNDIKEPQVSILKFAKTPDEKAFVYTIRGFHKPRVDLTALEQVYKVQPRSPLIKLLLVREINKIEESYLSKKLDKTAHHNPYSYLQPYVGEDSTIRKQRAYIPKLITFCRKLATDGKYAEPAIGNLAIAYLNWIQGNTQQGLDELAEINDQKLNIKLNDQRQMISLLLQAQKINHLDTIAEQELLPGLTWLDQKAKWEAKHTKTVKPDDYWWDPETRKPYSMSARDFYTLVLAPAYLKQKDTAMASFCMLRGQQIIPPDRDWSTKAPGFNLPDFLQRKLHAYDLLKLISIYKSQVKTPYISMLTSEITPRLSYDLYDVLGTAYLREYKYALAVKAFNHIPASIAKHTPYTMDKPEYADDPFADNNIPKTKKAHPLTYTKLMFARKMANMQRMTKNDPKNAAAYYYKMATGLYNTSHYGAEWYLTAYSLGSARPVENKPDLYFHSDFLQTNTAERYFIKARESSKNDEFKARCTFMAAECKRSQIENRGYKYDYSDPKQYDIAYARFKYNLSHNPYFTELKKRYSNTAYYKQAVNECVYLQDFLSAQFPVPVQQHKVIVQ